MARNMISKRFDVTTGNPRKLFGFVRDSIMNAGYDTSPEKGGAFKRLGKNQDLNFAFVVL